MSYTVYKHIPPIPTYHVDVKTFEYLVTNIVPDLQPLIFQNEPSIIPYCTHMLGKLWVPTICEGNEYICLVAVSSNNSNQSMSFGTGYSHLPKVGLYNDTLVSLSDEVIWVCK